jgi:hypothetical protein
MRSPTTRWSSTRISNTSRAVFSRLVMVTSAWLGSGSPDGWLCALCARNRYVAPFINPLIRQPHLSDPGHIISCSPAEARQP